MYYGERVLIFLGWFLVKMSNRFSIFLTNSLSNGSWIVFIWFADFLGWNLSGFTVLWFFKVLIRVGLASFFYILVLILGLKGVLVLESMILVYWGEWILWVICLLGVMRIGEGVFFLFLTYPLNDYLGWTLFPPL